MQKERENLFITKYWIRINNFYLDNDGGELKKRWIDLKYEEVSSLREDYEPTAWNH